MYDSIRPGQIWLDTDGNRIQAHGGSILAAGDTFYWYGENKEKTKGDPSIWHWGVRCYSSKDLYNWKSEGIIIPPDLSDDQSPLRPSAMMDRPHIVYNEYTGKYVAWLKIMGEPPCFAVLRADRITGPYEMVDPKVNPCGLEVGDFDLQIDPDTKICYLISEKPHTEIYVAELNREYTNAAGTFTSHFPHAAPPLAREAPAHFMRNHFHYLFTSGTTGYHPNPSEVAVSENWNGPYKVLGDPHKGDKTRTSFNSQITSVFRHPFKKDLYIALADRWIPDLAQKEGQAYETGEAYAAIEKKFEKIFDPASEFVFSPEDAKEMFIDSSISDYVWLPVCFEGDRPFILWRDEWKTEEFADR